MRPRTIAPLLVLPLLLLGLAFAPGASAREGRVGTFPVSFTIQSPCTGEEVAVEGVVHFVGGDHFRYKLSGVGTSGAVYQLHSIDNEGTAPSAGAYAATSAATFRFVREGGGGDDDFTAHSTVHTT